MCYIVHCGSFAQSNKQKVADIHCQISEQHGQRNVSKGIAIILLINQYSLLSPCCSREGKALAAIVGFVQQSQHFCSH